MSIYRKWYAILMVDSIGVFLSQATQYRFGVFNAAVKFVFAHQTQKEGRPIDEE
jgi:hypothetical protein